MQKSECRRGAKHMFAGWRLAAAGELLENV